MKLKRILAYIQGVGNLFAFVSGKQHPGDFYFSFCQIEVIDKELLNFF